ncbi:MAG: bifunctional demethylmenaquinone methyltransferase/2-methoxy-6-polyprenyl-1,4-benzoquinol methylase UbiE [Pyrinomonadaceae bacterium]|nr:bifunctional demethylmenaquinone methyltransferase/2-methoxy-6-polyprenyl-1,4-benzoquinol methylase UbiE [Pyrinomonadaceae bacterium]MCX7640460.1 bifunctional demethylmenaquinone methyltransferase/2-methoxy-6-polyprenyl-1,4-benzoquinol methylase UbiE [Pyrinomonadaceae bacterium]MDW8304887.1 bifunctional demethylmenaquinone methyltransferase/2-methoxy-6-polyprenyl-1,4-benzoquinol methylase UbiE [Acidobacteriota bacterium]
MNYRKLETRNPAAIREMFSRIAPRYDFLNHLLSFNIDRHWRKRVCRRLDDILENPAAVVLDLACGTGDLSIELKNVGKAKIFGVDFCHPMLQLAMQKTDSVPFIEGDGLNLPFEDLCFDAVTIAFGLRNFADWELGLRESYRVLKPFGRLVVLEFSTPVVPGFKQVFDFYFNKILPFVGGFLSRSMEAYAYLPRSVSHFPDQDGLKRMMEHVGFSKVEYENLTGGIAAVHCAWKL